MSIQHITDSIEGEYLDNERRIFPVQLINPSIRSARVYNPPLFEKERCRLYMNENLFGPSPKCLDILRNILPEQLYLYPYGGDQEVIKAIAKHIDLEAEQVMVNQGSAAIIQQVLRTFLSDGDAVLIPKPGWDYYRSVAEALGARIFYYNIVMSDDRYEFDIDTMVNAIQENSPKIVIVTSPNMPTGNMISLAGLNRLAQCLENGIVLLDEAYYGFAEKKSFNEYKLLSTCPNVVITRTFSKIYGLASARLGYAFCDGELCSMLRKTAPLFGVTWLSQQLAKAALDDVSYYEGIKKRIVSIREKFRCQINRIEGLWAYPSEANFVLINAFGWPSDRVAKYCYDNGYLIRDCNSYQIKNHLRISIGREEHMDEIIRLFLEFEHSCKQ